MLSTGPVPRSSSHTCPLPDEPLTPPPLEPPLSPPSFLSLTPQDPGRSCWGAKAAARSISRVTSCTRGPPECWSPPMPGSAPPTTATRLPAAASWSMPSLVQVCDASGLGGTRGRERWGPRDTSWRSRRVAAARRRAVCSQPSLCSPAPPAPGHLQCPVCLALGSCSQSSNVMCPKGTSHCYKGQIFLRGGEY